jgi:hypothetical protein
MTLDPVALLLSEQWSFKPTEELPGGHCSRVYATADKVLKVPYQGEEMTTGYLAIARLGEPYGPEIFESDVATGSMLMARAIPGTKLHESGLTEKEQFEVWLPIAKAFQTISKEGLMPFAEYAGLKDPLVVHLLETTEREVSLHGDLHHENILKSGDGWMCIDAKGLIGDPAIEGAAFICNPFPEFGDMPPSHFIKRIQETANALEVDPFRVWGWSVARMREETPTHEPWRKALVTLNKCAAAFDAEQWVLPLA